MPIVIANPAAPIETVLTFTTSGAPQAAVIPAGVTEIIRKMWGAGGGSGTWDATSRGGGGGYSDGTLAITGPVTLDVYVGGGGGYSTSGGAGGYPQAGGGGDGSFSNGGGGGGFSGVFPNGNFTTPYMIAGGGAGGGTNNAWPGGGLVDWYTPNVVHGQLGSQVAGGAGGIVSGFQVVAGSAGSFLTGGAGAPVGSGHAGGGGGSGYYGGGGGSAGNNSGGGGQGGGGSSYIGHIDLTLQQTLYNTDGANLWHAANEADGEWVAGANGGRGGALGNPGQAGKVIIKYTA